MIIVFKFLLLVPYFLWMAIKIGIINLLLRLGPNLVSERRRYKFARRLSQLYCWLLSIKVVPHHQKYWVDGAVLLVSNHQSTHDGFMLMTLNNFEQVAPIAFIIKHELSRSWPWRYFLKLINFLLVDRSQLRLLPQYLASAVELIKIPRSLVVFPAGSRSHSDQVGEFKATFLRVAQTAYSPIVPVTIINAVQVRPWSFHRHYVHIFFLPTIKPATFTHRSGANLAFALQSQIQTTLNSLRSIINSPVAARKLYRKTKAQTKLAKKHYKIK